MNRQMGYCVAATVFLVWANAAIHYHAPLQSVSLGAMGLALTIMVLVESHPHIKIRVAKSIAGALFGSGFILEAVLLLRGA